MGSTIQLGCPGDEDVANFFSWEGVWKIARLQSYTPDMGSVLVVAECSGGCACEAKTIHGWVPFLTNATGQPISSEPQHYSMVRAASLRVSSAPRGAAPPAHARLGSSTRPGCDCSVSLRLVEPETGAAPYHLERLCHLRLTAASDGSGNSTRSSMRLSDRPRRRREDPKDTERRDEAHFGKKFKLLGLAMIDDQHWKSFEWRGAFRVEQGSFELVFWRLRRYS